MSRDPHGYNASPRVYNFLHRQCGHSREVVLVPVILQELFHLLPNAYNLIKNNADLIQIRTEDFCDDCMWNFSPSELRSLRKLPPPNDLQVPSNVRDRVQGVWRRLGQNPGLVLLNRLDDPSSFNDPIQHNTNYLTILMQDLHDDILYSGDSSICRERTHDKKALFLQLRHTVHKGLLLQLEEMPFDEAQATRERVWCIDLSRRDTIFKQVSRVELQKDEASCVICGDEYFEYPNFEWAPLPGYCMPVRVRCCNTLLCRDCAIRLNGENCPFCRSGNRLLRLPTQGWLAPFNEEEDTLNPSPPWMEIFRPTE